MSSEVLGYTSNLVTGYVADLKAIHIWNCRLMLKELKIGICGIGGATIMIALGIAIADNIRRCFVLVE
ncbi:16306_t:CDS:1, partial [Dentiscutata erythropus]